MYDYDSLKNRVKNVTAEYESLKACSDTPLNAHQKGLPSQLKEIEKTIENMNKKGHTISDEWSG